jgi:outer membrane lipoprotein-sorting protein
MQLLRVFFIFLMLISFQLAAADGKQNYTLDEMASRIQKQSGAQILSAEIQQTKQGKIYRFKVKKKGRVRVLLMRPDGSSVSAKRK